MRYETITAVDCAVLARLLSEGLAAFGITVNPTSDVGRMIEAFTWMGSFPPDAVQPDAAFVADPVRSQQAFPLYEQGRRVAEALHWAQRIPGAQDKVRRLRKRLDRLTTQDAPAQDYLFELEIAQRLARYGHDIAFQEPDIVLTASTGDKLGLACKRPRSAKSLGQCLDDAVTQIVAQPFQGVIVIGTEPLFHKSDDPKRPTVLYLGTPDVVVAEANRRLDEAVDQNAAAIIKAFAAGAAGILFCGLITGWAQRVEGDRSLYHFQWVHRALSHPDALGVADFLETALFPPAPESDTD